MRKSHSCGISAIFFECYLVSETQILMTVSDFLWFFCRKSFPGRGLHFSMGGVQMGSFIFEWGEGAPWGKHEMDPCDTCNFTDNHSLISDVWQFNATL